MNEKNRGLQKVNPYAVGEQEDLAKPGVEQPSSRRVVGVACAWIWVTAGLPPGVMTNLGFEECFPLSIGASLVTLLIATRVIASQLWFAGKLLLVMLLVLGQTTMWQVTIGELDGSPVGTYQEMLK